LAKFEAALRLLCGKGNHAVFCSGFRRKKLFS